MGRVSALHSKWVRLNPAGAMSAECQELNALYSLAVDGGSVKIPERLIKLPERPDLPPFVLEVLHKASQDFSERFHQIDSDVTFVTELSEDVARDMVIRLLASESATMSEYEVVCKAVRVARKHSLDFSRYLPHIDFSALTVGEKYALSNLLDLSMEEHPYVWNRWANSCSQSDIVMTNPYSLV